MKKKLLTLLAACALTFYGCNNNSEMASGTNLETENSPLDEKVYTLVDEQPEFPGGFQSMYEFLGNNILYPEQARKANVQGKVFLSFVVSSTGEIRDVKVLKGVGYGLDEEAERVVKKMPKWQPGREDGKEVAVRYNLPVVFQLKKQPTI
ncbi:energy transducer TonB [Salmonirosea aquatica]|uniref:TonB family protein n=1 Tax=Salmonirosea aquatica TaxID=2654236 RepID=A0A7C9F8E7_9BACT|nr:TonB family protein [Cytophagaceae bacterium SJW1-29]